MMDQKATTAYVKSKEQLIMKNGLLYRQSKQGPVKEIVFQFVVPQIHRSAALGGCHHEAAHQGQHHSLSLMQERFWWPGMAHNLRNHIKKCGCCRKFEAAPPVAPLKPLTCSGPGELLHMDFTSIEETVPHWQELVIRNVMVMQDHFSKYIWGTEAENFALPCSDQWSGGADESDNHLHDWKVGAGQKGSLV